MTAPAQNRSGIIMQLLASLGGAMRRMFYQTRSGTIIVGADARMRLLATELTAAGKRVSLIEMNDQTLSEPQISLEWKVIQSNAPDDLALERAGAKDACCLVATTPNNDLNLEICRTGRDRFHVPRAIARMRLLKGVTSWARINGSGTTRISWADAARIILGDVTPRTYVARVANATDLEHVADVEMLSPVFAGRAVAECTLPNCEVVSVTRECLPVTDFEHEELRIGDVLTLVGSKGAIDRVRETFTSL